MAALALVAGLAWADPPFEEGLRLLEAGEYVAAKEHFEASSDGRARSLVAVVEASLGRCEDALPELLAAGGGEEDPSVQRLAGLAAARCAIAAKRFDEALNVLVELERAHPGDADILYETARLHIKGWNEAVAVMFAEAPSSFRVNQLSAEIFEIQGRYDDAVREYGKAIAKAPGTINLHYRLGRALLMRSHEPEALEQAMAEFRAELRLNPRDAVAEFQVGQILQVLGREEEALPHFQRAVGLDPGFPEAMIALGKERARLQQFDEAIALLRRALELRPESEPAHYSLMLAYRNAGRREDAQRMQRALERLQSPEGGEFSEFLKRIGEAP